MTKTKTHDYDPRYDKAQTIDGAAARFLDEELDYDSDDLERDLHEIIVEGREPSRQYPRFEGQRLVGT